MKKEKVEFDNLSYKELQEIYSKLRKDLIQVDKRLKEFDKSISRNSDGGRGNYTGFKHIVSRMNYELEEAFKLITEYQEWRRGSQTISMPNPTDLGRAIDVALKIMAEKLVSDKK